jgi:Tfp pilus assembly protein PilP
MIRHLCLLLLAVAMLACGDEEASSSAAKAGPKSEAPTKKARTADPKAPASEEAFIYRADGVRDPFQAFIVTMNDDEQTKKCPLCLPLSNLSFTGIVTGIASPVALIETRDGVGYFVRRGSELGANGGRIIDIREGVILLRERFQDQLGRISVVDRSLRIRSDDPMASEQPANELIESSDPRPANVQNDAPEEERIKKTSGPADEL